MIGRPTWILSLAVTFAVVLTMLGIGECTLRSFAPIHLTGIQSAYEYDAELGYRLKSGVHQFLLTDHLQEIRTGKLGNVGFADDFARYPTLVFALGDSYTQGTGNPSDTAYPFQLDMLLNQNAEGFYSERFGIVNLGLAAFGTDQSLLAARRFAQSIGKPQYVLYLGCDNDYDDDQLFRSGYQHQHLVTGSPRWGKWVEPLMWLSDFEISKRLRLALAKIREARRVARTEAPRLAPEGAPKQSVAERVWPSIAEIVAQARAWDAKVVLSWVNPNTPSYVWLQKKAAEEGIPFADWVPRVESVQQRMTQLPLGNPHSSGHWRPWANRVIAESYARSMGVWPPSPESHGDASRSQGR